MEMVKKVVQTGKCSACGAPLAPNAPHNKFYDPEIGSVTICADCIMKACLWYVRKLHGLKVK